MPFLFLDLETTGLDAFSDQITEAAWVLEDGTERQFFVEHTRLPNEWVLQSTDYATRILPAPKNRFDQVLRQLQADCGTERTTYLVGANPSFDDRFLRYATRWTGTSAEPPYHYHLIDIETLAMGVLGLPKPPRLKELRALLGIPGENPAAHTALSDALEVQLIFEAIVG